MLRVVKAYDKPAACWTKLILGGEIGFRHSPLRFINRLISKGVFRAFVERSFAESLAGRPAIAARPKPDNPPYQQCFPTVCIPSHRSGDRPVSTGKRRLSATDDKDLNRLRNR